MTPPPYTASRRHFLALSAATALAAAGCSAPENTAASGKPSRSGGARLTKIGLDYPFTQLPLYSTLVKLSTARAKQHRISLLTTSDNASADTQATNLNTWVARKVPAIVSFPMVFEAAEPLAKAALDAGLIWVTYGGSLEHQSADIRFSFREGGTLLGAAAAQWAQEHLGGKGKIAFLTDNTIELGRERTKGMIDAFTKAAPGVDVVAREQSIDPDTGLSRTKAILAKHPDLNLVLGVTDAAAYGGFKALQQAGRAKDDAKTFVGGKGKIAFLTDNTIELGRERTKGMIDAFTKAAPGVDVVAREQSIDPDTGLSRTKAILAKHPDLNLVLGVTDAAAYGGFKALQQAGRAKDDAKTFVGGQDGSAPSLLAVKQGTFYRASAALAPKDIAAAIVDVPRAVAAGKTNAGAEVPITLVQRADTARIDALLAQNA